MSDNQLQNTIEKIKNFEEYRKKQEPIYELWIGGEYEDTYTLKDFATLFDIIENIYEKLDMYKDMKIVLYYVHFENKTEVIVIQEGAD